MKVHGCYSRGNVAKLNFIFHVLAQQQESERVSTKRKTKLCLNWNLWDTGSCGHKSWPHIPPQTDRCSGFASPAPICFCKFRNISNEMINWLWLETKLDSKLSAWAPRPESLALAIAFCSKCQSTLCCNGSRMKRIKKYLNVHLYRQLYYDYTSLLYEWVNHI